MRNFFITFGVWLMLIPLLGVPIHWRDVLVEISGVFLISVVLGPTILNKLKSKPKQQRKKNPVKDRENQNPNKLQQDNANYVSPEDSGTPPS